MELRERLHRASAEERELAAVIGRMADEGREEADVRDVDAAAARHDLNAVRIDRLLSRLK